MMDLYRIYLFCSLTNCVFVERGTHYGVAGYWFADNRTQQRTFLTEDHVESALSAGTRDLEAISSAEVCTAALAG